MDLGATAAWIVDEAQGGARWIAVDGLGASGKSSLAAQVSALAASRGGPDIAVVHFDDFTRPGAVGWERDRFVAQVWQPLTSGIDARHQRWHWTDDEPGEWVDIAAGSVVLVEGIGASEPPEGVVWNRVVWVAAAPQVRAARAERRDAGRFGCWSQTWRPIEDEWFARAMPWRAADVVCVNTPHRR